MRLNLTLGEVSVEVVMFRVVPIVVHLIRGPGTEYLVIGEKLCLLCSTSVEGLMSDLARRQIQRPIVRR